MQVCPGCGAENPDPFRLCGYCGTPLARDSAPREVRKVVSIVFSDLQGSTSLGERVDSESLRELMSRYFDEMKAIVERHGGTVEKFIGDAVMAVFGLPQLHEDDALRAVRAAGEMRDRLVELNAELEATWGVSLVCRIGVNTGEVVAGDPAAGQRLVLGDAVNVAARLEQAAPPMGVLIGPSTHRLVRGAVDVEPVDPLTLKGKAEPVPALLLVAVRGADVLERHLEAPMVGRGAELQAMLAAFRRAQEGARCELVVVVGQAGVGKSRLVAELVASVGPMAVVRSGRCLPYGDGITFWPLAEIARGAASITDDDTPQQAAGKLAELLPDDAVRERVGAAIGMTAALFPIDETFWGARKLVEQLAANRPAVVVMEDVHWAEPTLLELVEHVARSAEARALIVCTARDDLLESHPEWGGELDRFTRIALEPLSDDESAEVLDNLLGDSGLPDEARARITGAAEGNPLFVEQMLSMLIEDGVLRRESGSRWTLVRDAPISVPLGISALLASRLDRLSSDERAVLERGSVIGQVFSPSAVRALSPTPQVDRVDDLLEALVAKRLVGPDGSAEGAFRFLHILIRDAAYQGLLKRSRAELHEGFADWLEASGIRMLEHEEIVGYHLEQAFRYRGELGPLDEHGRALGERAVERLLPAGRRALERGDLPAAVNLLERTASLMPADDVRRAEIVPDLAEALSDIGEYARAETWVEEATARARAAGDRRLEAHARIAGLLVRYSFQPEDWTEHVLAETPPAIHVFEEVGDHVGLAQAWRLVGLVHATACRFGAAEDATRVAIEHARRAGDRRQEIRNLHSYAQYALYGPMPVAEALARCEEVMAQAQGDRRTEGLVTGYLAHLHAMGGSFERARALSARSRAVLEDLGERVTAASTSLDGGPVELLAGDYVAAERELRRDAEALEAMGERYLLSTVAALLAQALYAQGRLEDAESYTRVSEETAAPDDVESQVIWRCARGKVLARRGMLDEGETLLREAVELIMETEEPDVQGHVLMDLAQVLLLAQRPEEAASVAERALSLYLAKGNAVSAAHAGALMDDAGARAGRAGLEPATDGS